MDIPVIGTVVLFLVLFFTGRVIASGAPKLLSDDDKARLVDLALFTRRFTIPAAIALVVAVFFLDVTVALPILAVAIIAYVAFLYRRLVALGFPLAYRRRFHARNGIDLRRAAGHGRGHRVDLPLACRRALQPAGQRTTWTKPNSSSPHKRRSGAGTKRGRANCWPRPPRATPQSERGLALALCRGRRPAV